ncbi:MAG: glucose-1-phosphate cytidylyltransferase [Flavobacteriales bacterium]
MKVLILAGGFGTRISEESVNKPKPLISVGPYPIIWHIMKIYSAHGFNEFVILLGYKGYAIKEYFSNYFLHQSDVTIDFNDNSVSFHKSKAEPWKVTMIDTGLNSMTGGRILRAKDYIGNEPFLLTYGDGVGIVDIQATVALHKKANRLCTMTIVQPEGRFGGVELAGEHDGVRSFVEKPIGDGGWINGGFFVCEPEVLSLIEDDHTIWEREPLEKLANQGQLTAYQHHGFWKPMDSMRDHKQLNELWDKGNAPWKIW